jgi:hypothetical protein
LFKLFLRLVTKISFDLLFQKSPSLDCRFVLNLLVKISSLSLSLLAFVVRRDLLEKDTGRQILLFKAGQRTALIVIDAAAEIKNALRDARARSQHL